MNPKEAWAAANRLSLLNKSLISMGGVIAMIMGAWFTLIATFASAAEFEAYKVASSAADKRHRLQTEQIQNELRLDILEDRIDRDANSVDISKRNKLQRQLNRLESRNLDIQNSLDNIK